MIIRIVVADNEQPLGIITVTDFVKHTHMILSDSEAHKSKLYENLKITKAGLINEEIVITTRTNYNQ